MEIPPAGNGGFLMMSSIKKIIKYAAAKTARPLLKKYLSSTRKYMHGGLRLIIPPGIFHPGFFFTTQLLLKHILTLQLSQKKFLELGAGSGLIAFTAAQRGAVVMATDISCKVVEYLEKNSRLNNLPVQIMLSDLFKDIPAQAFDIIAINPPFYKKHPVSEPEFAWYCGENGEYFFRLFEALKNYMHEQSLVFMVLSDECDLKMIRDIAAGYFFILEPVKTKKMIWEINFIFKINPVG